MKSGALIIAAGFSRRFGSDKRLYRMQGDEPLLIASLRPYQAVFANVAVVVRSSDSELTQIVGARLGRHLPIIIPTEQAHLGMAASIADGVRTLVDWDYLFLGLGDMPYVRSETLAQLKAEMEAARADRFGRVPRIVVPTYRDEPGHPVGFSREFFAQLIALTGDRGARSVIDAHPSAVRRVDVDDPGVVTDIDQPPM
jgi:molybdenum cofactor cytidylyltransferase